MKLTLEHVDPKTHSLVCGLCNDFNEVLADASYNYRKQNRFVPYRVKDYPAPVTFGDTAEFLVQGQWVVCEFGGETWWAESNRVGCGSNTGNDWTRTEKHKQNMREVEARFRNDPRVVEGRLKGAKAPASPLLKHTLRMSASKPLLLTRQSDGHVFWFNSSTDAGVAVGVHRKRLAAAKDTGKVVEEYLVESWNF